MTTMPVGFEFRRSSLASLRRLVQQLVEPRHRVNQFATLTLAGLVSLASPVSAAPVGNCPADFNGDRIVDGADLGVLLLGWGQPGPSDLDGSGVTNSADLNVLLAAWGACPKQSPTIFTGIVSLSDGTPVSGAVVVTDLGGTATTSKAGDYELSLMLDKPVGSATISAVATVGGTTFQGSTTLETVTVGAVNEADPIVVSPQTSCGGEYAWLPGFEQSVSNAFWGTGVYALKAFDDGSGNALYAGGWFDRAGGPGGVAAANIAKWDGLAWTALGSGLDGPVDALAVFDDGTGPALYAGGRFMTAGGVEANRIAKWDGTAWTPLGSGMNDTVWALTVFDDGTGPALYAGGDFTTAGGVEANRIAKWDGAEWTPLGSGLSGAGSNAVRVLTVFDDGTGPALYAGGNFTTAGDSPASRVARWDGTGWAAVGSGPDLTWVWGLVTIAGPEGPELVVGGYQPGPFCSLQRWNGTSWSVIGACSLDEGSYCNACDQPLTNCWSVVSLYAPVAPGFPEVLIGGGRCGGIGWSQDGFVDLSGGLGIPGNPPPPPYSAVFAWEEFDDGSGTKIYAGGPFLTAGGQVVRGVAAWDGDTWFDVDGGVDIDMIDLGLNATAWALTVFDDGTGPALYAGGDFTTAGGAEANFIAKWDGSTWTSLGSGMNGSVAALTVFDDGTGPALYAGGFFTSAGDVEANRIAKWDGAEWTPLGSGIIGDSGSPPLPPGARRLGEVWALTVFDDGTGPALYAGGWFTTAGGVDANNIARWDGTAWSPLGTGASSYVLALTAFNDGTGPALYAGGSFDAADGVQANHTAKWDGAEWTTLGGGMSGDVHSLAVFDDGTGPALFAGGFFTTAGGAEANRIAKWDGLAWTTLGSGIDGLVSALTVFDDGTGPALYAGGFFTTAGGAKANRIAKWDGDAWTPLRGGLNDWVRTLTVFDDGTGPELYAGGYFTTAGGVSSSRIAKWGCVD